MDTEIKNTDLLTEEEAEELEDILEQDDTEDPELTVNSIENVIEWLNRQDIATFTISQKKYKNRIEHLAEKYPDECKILHRNTDGSIVAKFPLNWIRISKPRTLTKEQRQAAAERLKKYRERQD